jgi:hypothetical protein
VQNYPGTPTDTVNTSTTFAQSTVTMIRTVRTGENLHVVLWLLKDLCWIMDLRVVGLVMVLPTVWLAVWITWRSRNNRSDRFHSAAVVCWILANSTWMIGEFFMNDGTRPLAVVFFVTGLVLIAWYYLMPRPAEGCATHNTTVTKG